MTRRVTAVWLLDSDEPSGTATMALRRVRVLRRHVTSTVIALDRGPVAPPPGPFRSILAPTNPGARLRLLDADVVVTTSDRTLAWAAARQGTTRAGLLHFVHAPTAIQLAGEAFMHTVPFAHRVVVPAGVDAAGFARAVGLDRDQVVAQGDFTLAAERLPSTASGQTVLALGRFTVDSGVLELAQAFALAADRLPGWQLWLCGWGPQQEFLEDLIDRFDLRNRVVLTGPRYDPAALYVDAGIVARVGAVEAAGLSVVEALAAGVPVLGSPDVPAVRTLVQHDVNGLVLARTDPIAVAEGLLHLAEPAVRRRLAQGARASEAAISEKGVSELIDLFTRPLRPARRRAATGIGSPAAAAGAPPPGGQIVIDGLSHTVMSDLSPRAARVANLDAVLAALAAGGVRAFVVRGDVFPVTNVGMLAADREAALAALTRYLPRAGRHLQEVYPDTRDQPVTPLRSRSVAAIPDRCAAVRVAQLWVTAEQTLSYGMDYGTVLEFWSPLAGDPDFVVAPLPNAAARVVHRDQLVPATIFIEGRDRPSIELFSRPFPTDVEFPIDAVYTWVDGSDPAWRRRFEQARAVADGIEYHPEAVADNRYEINDELRYSLRSLQMYAPWIRHIYLVTDQQVPLWLAADSDRITVVDHRDIFRDPAQLPVFNSSAIITALHHIPGLSEHYLYLNDDMFFGHDVAPETFWYGSGIAKVFPSRQTRPFGAAHAGDEPHLNISRNIRAALEETIGRSISLAIRHTPYPQIRSVNAEIEERYGDIVRATAGQRFRHHSDIALDQLFHYYAQATGRAVASTIPYDYVNVADAASIVRLRRLLASRTRTVFCLNDAPVPGVAPIPRDALAAFLEAYFPVRSEFEL